jgi:hypothetical protein
MALSPIVHEWTWAPPSLGTSNPKGSEGGKLRANTQTAALMKQVEAPAYLAISERASVNCGFFSSCG